MLPRPARTRWSMRTALMGARRFPIAWRRRAAVKRAWSGSGPSPPTTSSRLSTSRRGPRVAGGEVGGGVVRPEPRGVGGDADGGDGAAADAGVEVAADGFDFWELR